MSGAGILLFMKVACCPVIGGKSPFAGRKVYNEPSFLVVHRDRNRETELTGHSDYLSLEVNHNAIRTRSGVLLKL